MSLSRAEIEAIIRGWLTAWNGHDLEKVMELFHDDAVFENWNGDIVRGRRSIERAWKEWFENHGGFQFELQDIMVDEEAQKALMRWRLKWPSREEGYTGLPEIREGIDILRFRAGLIDLKLTFTKTALEIGGKKMKMALPETHHE